jgi:TetR/AcrR family transcriptional repressor of nem operon
MRYHIDDKEKTRLRILRLAARRFRAEGLMGVGIANLMADLGMTHGGFYAHFADKEALVASACTEAFRTQLAHWDQLQAGQGQSAGWSRLLNDYLSLQHRDHPDNGCFAAALASEMARRDDRSRRAFSAGIEQLLARLQQTECSPLPADATLALMVGAMMLARAVSDPGLSERLLCSAVQALQGRAPD